MNLFLCLSGQSGWKSQEQPAAVICFDLLMLAQKHLEIAFRKMSFETHVQSRPAVRRVCY